MVQFGTVAAGQTVSSAFTLQATDRVLLIGVGSHAALTWWASFQANPGGPFVRYLDSWNTFSGAVFAGTGGAWGMVPYPPVGRVQARNQRRRECDHELLPRRGASVRRQGATRRSRLRHLTHDGALFLRGAGPAHVRA